MVNHLGEGNEGPLGEHTHTLIPNPRWSNFASICHETIQQYQNLTIQCSLLPVFLSFQWSKDANKCYVGEAVDHVGESDAHPVANARSQIAIQS